MKARMLKEVQHKMHEICAIVHEYLGVIRREINSSMPSYLKEAMILKNEI